MSLIPIRCCLKKCRWVGRSQFISAKQSFRVLCDTETFVEKIGMYLGHSVFVTVANLDFEMGWWFLNGDASSFSVCYRFYFFFTLYAGAIHQFRGFFLQGMGLGGCPLFFTFCSLFQTTITMIYNINYKQTEYSWTCFRKLFSHIVLLFGCNDQENSCDNWILIFL